LPCQLLTSLITVFGLSFEISFKLFATLLLTTSDLSFFNCSRIGIIGVGLFFNDGIAIAQGSLGLQPYVASHLTSLCLCFAHKHICFIISTSYLIINGLTANSQLVNCVIRSKAFIDVK
jgi:hypothetical protein